MKISKAPGSINWVSDEKLVGTDRNALTILGKVKQALEQAGVPRTEIEEFLAEGMSADCDNLLRTLHGWVEVSRPGRRREAA